MKSLYSKFVVFTLGTMIMSALIAFLAVNTFYHQVLKDKNDEKNMEIALSLASFIESEKKLDLEGFLQTQAATGYKIYVVNEKHKTIQYGAPFRVNNLSEDAVSKVLNRKIYHGMRDFPTETFVTGFFSDELANTVGVPFRHNEADYALFLRPDIKFLFTEVHYLLGGMIIIMAIISVLVMLIVAKKLIDPITKLTMASKEVGKEQFSPELDINQRDEIGQLAQSFRNMTERLNENDKIRKNFISDVSHDFQSPLLNIKGYAELLMDSGLPETERKNFAKVIQSETERLSSLTNQLMLLTSLDQLVSPLRKRRFKLNEQMMEVTRRYRWLLEEKDMSLSIDLDETEIFGDPAFLEKVWENLLSNALKYTEAGGSIDITLNKKEDGVVVSYCDSGIGIEEKHLERIFDRFYRADESRTKQIPGTGLGLSIVHQVVKLHGGSIDVRRNTDRGMKFIVKLPSYPDN
ncbi:sensor histidine kinase [Bacillus norwichensis]|uniref:Heme sensor protein HssS n=1 Tax=Bacillus norwichensis TaxID=2762217 RepID=A0ABR8VII2_9BACI|nr:HAMP domain-containing sensor histidine kinase [Bacillus norwichensis]MBD8004507.1 HAMP domain-containing histidine kinase [Bacillus norwichensis]